MNQRSPFKLEDIIGVTVKKAVTYGLWCNCQGFTVLIRISEISWIASFSDCTQFASQGDVFNAKVVFIREETQEVFASIKEAYPDSNPWAGKYTLSQGEEIIVRFMRRVENADRCNDAVGYLVELKPGAYGMLCDRNDNLQLGGRYLVRISDVNVAETAIALEAASGLSTL
jgi:hypothetical protein